MKNDLNRGPLPIIFSFLLIWMAYPLSTSGQTNFQGKKISVFISSKTSAYTEPFVFPVTQFLKIEEDRSWTGDLKAEFLIRLGELFCAELQEITQADTVIFLNADINRGQQFLANYDLERRKLVSEKGMSDSDHLLIIQDFTLKNRLERSVFIRSNRMYSEKVPVKQAELRILAFSQGNTQPLKTFSVCRDERNSGKVSSHFDFYNAQSKLGDFLSQVFSNWWEMDKQNLLSNCSG
ncbi:MAG: hypothetical protein AAF824_15970 [Bacteroidota bacterium]